MTNDNQDALRCAEAIDSTHWPEREVAAHLRRLVAENEALRESVKKANEQAEHFEREWYLRGDQNEAKDALLRKAVVSLKQAKDAVDDWGSYASEQFQKKHDLQGDLDEIQEFVNVIRQHLDKKTT